MIKKVETQILSSTGRHRTLNKDKSSQFTQGRHYVDKRNAERMSVQHRLRQKAATTHCLHCRGLHGWWVCGAHILTQSATLSVCGHLRNVCWATVFHWGWYHPNLGCIQMASYTRKRGCSPRTQQKSPSFLHHGAGPTKTHGCIYVHTACVFCHIPSGRDHPILTALVSNDISCSHFQLDLSILYFNS